MIKKFEEYISEGFWKDGIKRAKDNIERIEDKLDSNIYDLNGIDMSPDIPFLVADDDLELDGCRRWLYDEIFPYENQFKKLGWRIPTVDEMLKYFLDEDGKKLNGEQFKILFEYAEGNNIKFDVIIKSKTNRGKLLFKYDGEGNLYLNRRYYWLRNEEEYTGQLSITPSDRITKSVYYAIHCEGCPRHGNVYRRIRLVKDKK